MKSLSCCTSILKFSVYKQTKTELANHISSEKSAFYDYFIVLDLKENSVSKR
jgi:hypothetical protein